MTFRTRATVLCGRALGLVALALLLWGPSVAHAAPGNQGLQAGWAVDEGGNPVFVHSVDSQLPIMKAAGAGWVRINFRLGQCFQTWTTVGCNGGTALQAYDAVVSRARESNLRVLGLLSNEAWHGNQPDWTANNSENNRIGSGDNAYIRAFASDAAGLLARHFAGKVTSWEVWNEPNAWSSNPRPGVYEGSSFIYPSNFAWLLRRSYDAIKAEQPGAVVISGGLFGHDPGGVTAPVEEAGTVRQERKRGDLTAPIPAKRRKSSGTAGPTCSTSVPSGADYLCATYRAGTSQAGWQAGAYPLDEVGQHLYVDQGGSTSGQKIATYLQDLRNAYLSFEGKQTDKTTQVTEVGWATPPQGSLSAAAQARNLQTAFSTFRGTSYVGRAYWFSGQDVPEGGLYFGLVDGAGTQKAAFAAYQGAANY